MSKVIKLRPKSNIPDQSVGLTAQEHRQAWATRNGTGMYDYVEQSQRVDRYLMHLLTPAEYVVLRFIIDRTFGWNKAAERVSLRQLESGSKDKTGEHRFYGTGLSRSGIRKALEQLCNDGILARERQGNGAYVYAYNAHDEAENAFFDLRTARKYNARRKSDRE